jgi:misacylated tRNA(Ala) deacylase
MPPDRTNMDLLPESVRELRVIQIGDQIDMCPCAGTHVSNLAELGHVEFLGKKSKGKGTQRFSYRLEEAASLRTFNDAVL